MSHKCLVESKILFEREFEQSKVDVFLVQQTGIIRVCRLPSSKPSTIIAFVFFV